MRTTNLPTDVTKSDEVSRNATAAVLFAAREQFERSFWYFPKTGYTNDDQRTAILLALLRRLEDHAVRFGNPALTGSEAAVQAFAYDVWYGEWREKLVKRNEPVTMALLALVKYWRDQVVRPDASRHTLVREFKITEAAKRKDPLLKPFPSPGFRFTPAPNGFSFTERVEASSTEKPETVTWTIAVVDGELQVSAHVGGATALPVCAPDLSDENIRLPEVSKNANLRRSARIFADAFLTAGLTTFKETIATVVVEGSRAKSRLAGFARIGLLVAVVALLVYSVGVFMAGRVAARSTAVGTVFSAVTICERGKEIVLIRGVTTDGRLRYTIVRDGIPLRDVAVDVRVNIAPSPEEMRNPNSRITATYYEGLRFVDRDVLAGSHHVYGVVIRHPSALFSFLKYEVPNPIDLTVGVCP